MRGAMQSYPVFQFDCGHVGRDSEGTGERAKVKSFIRVAERRSARLEEVAKTCPECKR